MNPECPRTSLSLLVGLPITAMLATGAFSLGLDPFGLYPVVPSRSGLDAQKPRHKAPERRVRAERLCNEVAP